MQPQQYDGTRQSHYGYALGGGEETRRSTGYSNNAVAPPGTRPGYYPHPTPPSPQMQYAQGQMSYLQDSSQGAYGQPTSAGPSPFASPRGSADLVRAYGGATAQNHGSIAYGDGQPAAENDGYPAYPVRFSRYNLDFVARRAGHYKDVSASSPAQAGDNDYDYDGQMYDHASALAVHPAAGRGEADLGNEWSMHDAAPGDRLMPVNSLGYGSGKGNGNFAPASASPRSPHASSTMAWQASTGSSPRTLVGEWEKEKLAPAETRGHGHGNTAGDDDDDEGQVGMNWRRPNRKIVWTCLILIGLLVCGGIAGAVIGVLKKNHVSAPSFSDVTAALAAPTIEPTSSTSASASASSGVVAGASASSSPSSSGSSNTAQVGDQQQQTTTTSAPAAASSSSNGQASSSSSAQQQSTAQITPGAEASSSGSNAGTAAAAAATSTNAGGSTANSSAA